MITVSYKDGVWKHVVNFNTVDEAHAYAKSEGYTSYKLTKGDRPMGVYTNLADDILGAPSIPQPDQGLSTPDSIVYETPITDEPQESGEDEFLERVVELEDEPEVEPPADDEESLPGLYEELPDEESP